MIQLKYLDANPYNATYNINQVTCFNGNDGSIDLNVSGSNSSLIYSWTSSNGYTSSNQDIFQLFSGNYYINITNANGCLYNDTIEILNPPQLSSVTDVSNCYNYFGMEIIIRVLEHILGLEPIPMAVIPQATLNLTVNDSSTVNITTSSCNSYLWNGNTYSSSGLYFWQGVNSFGCDSNVYLNLTVNNDSYNEVDISTCSTYNWNGTVYDESGIYFDTLTNIYGCDSVVKLSLNVSNFSISATSPVCEFDSSEVSITISYLLLINMIF